MGYAEEALDSRNDGIYKLHEIDAEMRDLWPITIDTAVRFSELEDERDCVVEALELMGVQTWPFDPERDLSWLPK